MSDGILAVDLGGTRLRVAVFHDDGTIVQKRVVPTPESDPTALLDAMRDAIATSELDVRGAVVGVPGPVSYADGMPLRIPNLPAWEGHVSAGALSESLGLPVLIANDADLAALGEHRFGAGRGVDDMLYLTSSTGVGGGVVIGGRLLHGRVSLAEAGHTVIERGSGATVEDLGSGTALERITGLDGAEVTRRARGGDPDALAALRDVADAFATGVYNMVHAFSPQRVVIGGGVSQAGDLLLGPVRERLQAGDTATEPDVVLAQGGDDVGLLGAFAFWLDSQS